MKNEFDYLFLLGGRDLEMVEIKKLLDDYKNNPNSFLQIDCLDNNLQWGAGLSSYSDKIPELNAKKIVGIELSEDIPVPPNYICIDHHGEKSDLSSSLEQLADLLKIPLDRRQMLVAVNDRSYIPGMMAFGATKDEIEEIRINDRKAQSVTEEDERLAVESIKNHLKVVNDIIVVESLTSKFSPITDRLFPYKRLLVYSDESLTYYGQFAGKVADSFHQMVMEKKAYFGGGENGFFGIAKSAFSTGELNQIREQIITIVSKEMR